MSHPRPSLRKINTGIKKRRLLHVARGSQLNSNTNNKWVEAYGDKVITDVFYYEGGVALVSNEKDTSGAWSNDGSNFYYGLVTQGEMAEWGLVDVARYEDLEASGDAEARHLDILPCNLEKLFDTTQVYTYFL